MKKLYYLVPFVSVPAIMLICELLDDAGMMRMSAFITGGLLLLGCAAVGFFSPTRKTFDCFIATLMPVALFVAMFVAGLLDQNDMGTRFQLSEALGAAFQPIALLLYLLMAGVTFFFSFKGIRALKTKADMRDQ